MHFLWIIMNTLHDLKALAIEKVALEHKTLPYQNIEFNNQIFLFFISSIFGVISYLIVISFFIPQTTTLILSAFFTGVILSILFFCIFSCYISYRKSKQIRILRVTKEHRIQIIEEKFSSMEDLIYNIKTYFSYQTDLNDCIQHIYQTQKYSYQLHYIKTLSEKLNEYYQEKNHLQYLLTLSKIEQIVNEINPVILDIPERKKQYVRERLALIKK